MGFISHKWKRLSDRNLTWPLGLPAKVFMYRQQCLSNRNLTWPFGL